MLKKALLALLLLGLLGSSVMWATSYTHYTSVGIDHDQRVNADNEQQQTHIQHSYYRVRWPGNGSIWLGGGKSLRPHDSPKPFEPFDLAATFMHPQPVLPPIDSSYNKAGFWFKSLTKPSRQIWLGVPSWLPVVVLGLLSFILWRRNRGDNS